MCVSEARRGAESRVLEELAEQEEGKKKSGEVEAGWMEGGREGGREGGMEKEEATEAAGGGGARRTRRRTRARRWRWRDRGSYAASL